MAVAPSDDRVGGCLCGAVRYRLTSAPFDTGYCHCRMCQRTAGAPVMVFSTVKGTAWDQGAATLEASTVAEKFWELHEARDKTFVDVVG